MKILDKKDLAELFKIVEILKKGIKLENFFGTIAEMPSSIDAKYVHELEKIVNEIKEKTDNYIVVDKEAIKNYYFISKKAIESQLKIANKDENIVLVYLPFDNKTIIQKPCSDFPMSDDLIKSTAIQSMFYQFGIADIDRLEQYCEYDAKERLRHGKE